ncbi:MAG TPA: hypothetical protein VGJ05_20615 [Fimbriiglobus sp.]
MLLFADEPDVATEMWKKLVITGVVGVVSTLASFLLGRWWGSYKAGREWHRKEFLGRVIVSLNIFADGFLKIRTVMERSLEEVFLNRVAVQKITAASRQTTTENPILPIPKEDRWFLLNFVMNAVAEQFASGHVKRDAGEKVAIVRYALFLTCEQVGDERIRKVRAMLLRKDLLETFPYADSMPSLENPWHADRIKTLRRAVELYQTEPDNFLTLEICV